VAAAYGLLSVTVRGLRTKHDDPVVAYSTRTAVFLSYYGRSQQTILHELAHHYAHRVMGEPLGHGPHMVGATMLLCSLFYPAQYLRTFMRECENRSIAYQVPPAFHALMASQ
jgi:hypothetical protein